MMTKTFSVLILCPMLLGATVVSTQANGAPLCVPSDAHHYETPEPTRKGRFVGHFDENGAPQSIATPSDDPDVTCVQTNNV